MSRLMKRAAVVAVIVVAGSVTIAEAQVDRAGGPAVRRGGYPVARSVYYAAPQQMTIGGRQGQPAKAHRVARGYPYLNAPMYPSPSQRVPYQVGGTMITNQAFAPHEMLHPHTYRALYPPFYYRVRGSWWVWPWGVESYDRWELQGTEVKVEYRSKSPLFFRFTRPWFN